MAFLYLIYWSTHSCFLIINHSFTCYNWFDHSRNNSGCKVFRLLRFLIECEYLLLLLSCNVENYHVFCRIITDGLNFHSQWYRRLIANGWLLDSGQDCFETWIFFDRFGDSWVGEDHCGIVGSRRRVLRSWLWDWIDSDDLRDHGFFINETGGLKIDNSSYRIEQSSHDFLNEAEVYSFDVLNRMTSVLRVNLDHLCNRSINCCILLDLFFIGWDGDGISIAVCFDLGEVFGGRILKWNRLWFW